MKIFLSTAAIVIYFRIFMHGVYDAWISIFLNNYSKTIRIELNAFKIQQMQCTYFKIKLHSEKANLMKETLY